MYLKPIVGERECERIYFSVVCVKTSSNLPLSELVFMCVRECIVSLDLYFLL